MTSMTHFSMHRICFSCLPQSFSRVKKNQNSVQNCWKCIFFYQLPQNSIHSRCPFLDTIDSATTTTTTAIQKRLKLKKKSQVQRKPVPACINHFVSDILLLKKVYNSCNCAIGTRDIYTCIGMACVPFFLIQWWITQSNCASGHKDESVRFLSGLLNSVQHIFFILLTHEGCLAGISNRAMTSSAGPVPRVDPTTGSVRTPQPTLANR